MKVLIISHNVFSDTESMGKTLTAYFSEYSADELAQLYFHSQVPTSECCSRYYRVTDKNAIKSIFTRKSGRRFDKQDIQHNRTNARIDEGVTASIYQKARKRTPLIYIARNLWWRMSAWDTQEFRCWLEEFKPDCVFFASGDYSFSYRIALKIAQSRNIPLYVSCMDDFYFFNKNSDSLLGKIQHRMFMRIVHKTMAYSEKLFCICDKMSEDYGKLFGKPCITVHTPATIREPLHMEKQRKVSYLGNLGYNRDKQLIDIGRALKSLGLEPDHVDVYSTESRPEILAKLTEENGIVFHGSVGADEVLKVIGESMAVIHTESFDEKIRRSVRYSVSTKIADSLASGTCIFAYGPEEIASIDYLEKNNAAICCTDIKDLEHFLKVLITDTAERNKVVVKALTVAEKNHAATVTPRIIWNEFQVVNGD